MKGGQIFNAIIAFFEEDDWDFHWLEGTSILSVGFTGKNGKWVCYAQAREEQEQFVFYSVCPINTPEDRRQAVAEFITRVNYGMIIGNFELDYDDGEIRYKTSIDVEGDGLTPALIKQMVYANVIITDKYLPGIMRVIYANSAPLDEIRLIEGAESLDDKTDELLSVEDDDFDEIESDDDLDDDDDDFDDDYPINGNNGTGK